MLLRATVVGLLAVWGASQAGEAVAGCLRFEPAEVELAGDLVVRVVPGPPNYVSISDGDRAERAFILVLPAPICVGADRGSELNSEAKTGIREVQVYSSDVDLKNFVGKSTIVRGGLFSAETGHHRTPIVLRATSARAG